MNLRESYRGLAQKRDHLKQRIGDKGVALSAGVLNVSVGLYEHVAAGRFSSDVFNAASKHDIFGDGGSYGLQLGALMLSDAGSERGAKYLRVTARLGLIGMSAYFASKAGYDLVSGQANDATYGGDAMRAASVSMAGNTALLWLDHNHEADLHEHDHDDHEATEHEETMGDVLRHVITDGIEAAEVVVAAVAGSRGVPHADQWTILVGHSIATGIVGYPWLKQGWQKIRGATVN